MTSRLAVALHLFNLALVAEFDQYLQNITAAGLNYDLYIAVLKGSDYRVVKETWPTARIFERENRGFDIASFLVLLHHLLKQPYDYILKLHSKSDHQWRRELLQPLLGSPTRVLHALALFNDPSVGMVGADKWLLRIGEDWGNNRIHIQQVCQDWRVPVQPCQFIGGTVFWARYSVFKQAASGLDLNALAGRLNTPTTLDWPWYLMAYPELKQQGVVDRTSAKRHWLKQGKQSGKACNCLYARNKQIGSVICDGMCEHAYERFFGLLVTHAGQRVVGVKSSNLLQGKRLNQIVLYYPQQDWVAVQSNSLTPQPLEYYNSYQRDTQERQLSLMRRYGIYGVCYCVNNDTRDFLLTAATSLPFCFSWKVGTTLDLALLRDKFNDPNYIIRAGKPLIYLDQSVSRQGLEMFTVSDQVLELPRSYNLIYRGVTLGDQSTALRKRLVAKYQQLLTVNDEADLFIKAWNDWSGHVALEPARNHGYALLEELAHVVNYFA